MKIEWNKVTWYSKLLAVILFVVVFCLGFNLGKKSMEINSVVVPDESSTVVAPINTVSYKCDAGKTILAKFYQGEDKPVAAGQMPIPTGSVALNLSDGRSMTIHQTISADGGRYANTDESFIFWSKGSGAFVMEGKSNDMTYKNCISN